MKANTCPNLFQRVSVVGTAGWANLTGPIRRFPQRLRDPRFWHIQALVLLATAPHYGIEILGFTNPFETLHGLAVTLYVLPLLYAALSFGWEGAVLTALWSGVLTSPSTWIWHRSEFHWFTELGQLLITLPVGILVAWRVDLETKQRMRAERTSASLSLLNQIGESLSHTLEVEQEIPRVLRRLLSGLALESVWLCLTAESPQGDPLLVQEAAAPGNSVPESVVQDVHARVSSSQQTLISDRHLVVPLVAEAGVIGSLGAHGSQPFSEEQVELFTTVAHQIQVALENARLYRQRQESMQSYVRQVTQAQEEERLRIARELHDETAQELVHLVRSLEQVQEAADDRLAERIDGLLKTARLALQSVRRYSRDLRPLVLDDLGLVAAIEMAVEDANQWLPQGARLVVRGKPHRVDRTVELALFRIAQEALRNVEKHAHASSAQVELRFGPDEIRLSISDDGAGFAPPSAIADLIRLGKLGLIGMKERAELVGGTLKLWSGSGQGTRVEATVPHPRRLPAEDN